MVEATNTVITSSVKPNSEDHTLLLEHAKEMLLDIVKDIASTDEARVKQSYLGEENIEELKQLEPATPVPSLFE